MSTARDLVADATNRLTHAGVASPSVDAAELLAHVLGTTRGRLLLQDEVTDEHKREFERLVTKRLGRTPLQHLTGQAGFRYLWMQVGPGAFVPRPETEVLTEIAIREVRDVGATGVERPVVVDLCSGTGAIAVSIATECTEVDVHAVELSPDALVWTHRNAQSHAEAMAERGSRLTVHQGDATQPDGPLAFLRGKVHVVVTNPPYIPDAATPVDPEVALHDPRLALYGGADGLDVIRGMLPVAAALLAPGGFIAIEHADAQGESAEAGVPALLRSAGWTEVLDHDDLNGRPRVTTARHGMKQA
jgi:release factor glutamine methyltransferase